MAVRFPRSSDRIASVINGAAVEVLKSQPSNSVGLICSDPPFFIGIGRDDHAGSGMNSDPWAKEVNSHRSAADWYLPIAVEAARVLRPGGSTVIMGGSQSIAAWEDAAAAAGLRWMAELTVLWNTGKPRARNFGSLTATIRWHIKPGGTYAFQTEAHALYSNVLVCTKVPLKLRHHPAQKPVELTNFLVSLLSEPNDLVIDPFCGSGSTLVSCAMAERSFIGCDLNGDYCSVAAQRVRDLDDEAKHLRPIYFWKCGELKEI